MKNIIENIERLLGRHDYVIIPNFGGFVIQTQSSTIDSEIINPPVSTISFNHLMKDSDGLLAIEVSRMKNINYRSAVKVINDDVLKFKDLLNKTKKTRLGKIGYFSLNDENKIVFIPSQKLNFLPINYGLKPLHNSIDMTDSKNDNQRKVVVIKLPTRKIFLKYAAIGIIAICLGTVLPQINNSNKFEGTFSPINKVKVNYSFQQKEEIYKSIELPPLTLPLEQVVSETQNNDTTIQQKQKNIQPLFIQKEKRFQVIIASLRGKSNAEYMKNIYTHDFAKIKILEGDKIYRISARGFEERVDAVDFLRTIRSEYPQFQDAWISEQ